MEFALRGNSTHSLVMLYAGISWISVDITPISLGIHKTQNGGQAVLVLMLRVRSCDHNLKLNTSMNEHCNNTN